MSQSTFYEFWKLENYGFILVEDDVEDKHLPTLLREHYSFNEKKIQAQRKRWQAVLTKKKPINRDNSDLKNLCRKGIPPEIRGQIWFQISGAEKCKKDKPQLYQNLKSTHLNEVTESTKQIDNDIDRTFP